MDFTISAEKYKNQLLTQEEQKNIDSEEMLNRLAEQQKFDTGFEGYKVRFENQEDFLEGQQVLASDEALVQYYEKHDPKMLDGLKSKSFINIAGKKAEKKKLRRKYLDARSDEKVEEAEAKKMWDAEVKELHENGQWGQGARSFDNLEEAKEALKKKDTDEIVDCFQVMGKTPEQLEQIRKKVSNLGHLRRQQMKELAKKSITVDADLTGVDNELIKEKQTQYAKTKAKSADWESYRAIRSIQEYHKTHQPPDDTEERVAKYNETHEKKIREGDIERTATAFMKEVKYTIKDGKKIPATRQDEENLKWNKQFMDSLLSDNESDWDFRFKAMDDMIQDCWKACLPFLKKVQDGTFNYKKDGLDVVTHYRHARHLLCISGMSDARTGLFRSKYAERIDKDYLDELDARFLCLNNLFRAMDYRFIEKGIDVSTFEFHEQTMDYTPYVQGFCEQAKTYFPRCNI